MASDESVDRKSYEPIEGLEPLRSLDVAVELIPMRSKMALHHFLRKHPQEFPPRYMRTYAGNQQRMLSDSEIRRARELLTIAPGMDSYHTEAMILTRPAPGQYNSGRKRRVGSAIDYIIRRATINA